MRDSTAGIVTLGIVTLGIVTLGIVTPSNVVALFRFVLTFEKAKLKVSSGGHGTRTHNRCGHLNSSEAASQFAYPPEDDRQERSCSISRQRSCNRLLR